MKQRILVAVVGVPALLGVLCFAPDWATMALIMALCIIGSHELLAAVLPPEKTRRWWGLAAALSVFVVADVYFRGEPFAGTPIQGLMPWLTAAQAVVVFICMVLEYGKKEEMDFTALCAILIAGVAIPMALTCLLRLRMLEHGAGLVLIPLVAAFMSDTMALFGGMLALNVRGMTLNVSSAVGFIALFGVAIQNGVIMISHINMLRRQEGEDLKQAVIDGTRHRFRPILMTATVAVLGLLPASLSAGIGSDVQRPLATVIVYGLLFATVITLYALPVLYYLVERRHLARKKPEPEEV